MRKMQIDPAGTVKILRFRTPSKELPQPDHTIEINSINQNKRLNNF
jgi:hypothetical protein